MADRTADEIQAEADALVATHAKRIAKVQAEYAEMGITMSDDMVVLMLAKRDKSMRLKDLTPSFGSERRTRDERSGTRSGRPGAIAGLDVRRGGGGPSEPV